MNAMTIEQASKEIGVILGIRDMEKWRSMHVYKSHPNHKRTVEDVLREFRNSVLSEASR